VLLLRPLINQQSLVTVNIIALLPYFTLKIQYQHYYAFCKEGDFERVGDYQTRHIDMQIGTTTNEDLFYDKQQGHFRTDLFYRLNIFLVMIPPLHERRDNISLLVKHFLKHFESMYDKTI
jgi:DNA-binding NtrC family response regulator